MLPAVIYARISSDKEGAGLGVARQEADCRELAAGLGLEVITCLTDNDISAAGGKPRPGYKQLLELIRSGTISTVLAWHTDRLHRRPLELEEYITACQEHSVVTLTVRAGQLDLATPAGQMQARILGATARFEIDHMIEKMKAAHLQEARSGRINPGGPRPFGFKDDHVTPEPAEAQAIREASDAVLEGVPCKAIARQWNADGIRPSRAAEWSGARVARVLKRARNAGLREYHGEVAGQAQWAAIVPLETWQAVRARLDSPGRRTNYGPNRRWLGGGLFLCGFCGDPLTTARGGVQWGDKPGRVYRCRKGTAAQPHVSRNAGMVDDYVRLLVTGWFARAGVTAAPDSPGEDLSALQAQMAALRERLLEAVRLHQQGILDTAQLTEANAENRAQARMLERRIAAAAQASPLGAMLGADDIEATWDALDVDRKRAIVADLMTVTLLSVRFGKKPEGWQFGDEWFDPDSIRIDWHR